MPPHTYSAPPDRPPYEEQAAYPADMFQYGHAPGESSIKCVAFARSGRVLTCS